MSDPSAPLVRALSAYGECHRNHRNLLNHALGIPLIVLALTTWLSRPVWETSALVVTPSVIAAILAAIFYLRLDMRTGMVMTLLLALFVMAGFAIAQISTLAWIAGRAALFALGWSFQMLGHKYEGRKPAFLDDLRSFLIGPLFMVVEGLFALGLMGDLRRAIEGR